MHIYVFSTKECTKDRMFQNSYLDKHQTDNKVLQSWKGKEFIEGGGCHAGCTGGEGREGA